MEATCRRAMCASAHAGGRTCVAESNARRRGRRRQRWVRLRTESNACVSSTVKNRRDASMTRTDGGGGSALSAASCAQVPANEGAGKPVAKHGCCARLPPAPSPSQAHSLAPPASDAMRSRAVPDDKGRRPQPAPDTCTVSTAQASTAAAACVAQRLRPPRGIAAPAVALPAQAAARRQVRGTRRCAYREGVHDRRLGCILLAARSLARGSERG